MAAPDDDSSNAGMRMKRLGKPGQVILLLASDKRCFITGHIIAVNGGKTAKR